MCHVSCIPIYKLRGLHASAPGQGRGQGSGAFVARVGMPLAIRSRHGPCGFGVACRLRAATRARGRSRALRAVWYVLLLATLTKYISIVQTAATRRNGSVSSVRWTSTEERAARESSSL